MTANMCNASAASQDLDLESVRGDFPALDQQVHGHPLIYLDNAATSQKPRAVLEAMQRYYERDNSNVHRGIHELSNRATTGYEGARERAARFINAGRAEDIVFTRGTTEGINLAAQAWGRRRLGAGDVILLTEMEHHSNLVPWQLVARQTGARLEFVPVTGDEGLLDLDRLDACLSSRVRLFAFTHVSNTLGTVNPAAELCREARRRGIPTLVDAAQSAGHMPVDVQSLGCDFLAFSGHKICGPTGIGVLFGRPERWAEMDPYQGGGEMILSVGYEASTWKEPPHMFEAGTPNIAGAIGLHAAMDYLDRLGRGRIFEHDQALGEYARERLSTLPGIRILGPPRGRAGLVSFHLRDVHAHDVVTMADHYGLALRGGHHCNQPLMRKLGLDSTVRASFYFYNRLSEVDRLVEVLGIIQQYFNRGAA
ncbi:MAG TPA: cysteine desulfurase [Candidatus Paceibacterota bacterium]|nr:cysteine desulfurase [Candidatus Paceibacterota bacterium]